MMVHLINLNFTEKKDKMALKVVEKSYEQLQFQRAKSMYLKYKNRKTSVNTV